MVHTYKKPETKVVTIIHDQKLMAAISGPTKDTTAEFNDGLSKEISFDFFAFEEEEASGKSDDDDSWEDWEEEEEF